MTSTAPLISDYDDAADRADEGEDDARLGEESLEEHEDGDGDGGESALLKPGMFIWGLTLCAGISGLLFGYE